MMTVFFIILGSLVGVGLLLRLTHRVESSENTEISEISENSECCGQHQICERESLLAVVSKDIEYFDDEELDRFAGREPDAYSDVEADEFRQIMLTTSSDELAAWVRSLQLRRIEIPVQLRDELLLMVSELRS